jgi:penicillin-binding protein A
MAAFHNRKTVNSQVKNQSAAWRKYQFRLRQKSAAQQALRRLPIYVLALCMGLLVIKGGFFVFDRLRSCPRGQSAAAMPEIEGISRSQLRELIDPDDLINPQTAVIHKQLAKRGYTLYTTLDEHLQHAAVAMMDQRYARQIGIVVMDAQSGKILVMATYDRNDPKANNCLNTSFPAASLFKIVSAAAALEVCDFSPDTRLAFNGGKYTLYRSQLKDTINQYTNYVTLEKAFAESINPVFGKIGQLHLDKLRLEQYAHAFGFNREMDLDLPMDTSIAAISEKPYNWAEIACGFNKTTRISAVHAAMLAATVIHNGAMMQPYLIDRAAFKDRLVFRQGPKMLAQAIHPETARQMQSLMNASVTSGTARSRFRCAQGAAILKHFDVGGKTASINDNPAQVKYEWFTGYARHRKSGKAIAAAVIVAHKDYIGVRAPEYFRKIVYEYMHHPLNASKAAQGSEHGNT